ncbi:AI-2E family transporter [Roseibacterium sp. SDUM158017]|uniref:AI-2E family transporter n=1 Tax=Roseicyclus salinarum TaxID=3036773 RepID=UPI002414DE8A|nr:AI-2E family transporter [Roseibacterium sp. SDUM158017]MDG4650495.1 AI-2E family transporter [Roseibacterium sp. SDUM158017]
MTEPQTRRRSLRLGYGLMGVILVILAAWALRGMATVVIPVIFAVFVTLAALPLDRAIAGRMPGALTWIGRAVVMLLLLLVLSAFIGGLAYCVTRIAAELPGLPQDLNEVLPGLMDGAGSGADGGSGGGSDSAGGIVAAIRGILQERGEMIFSRVLETGASLARTIASAMGVVFVGMFLVLFLVLLALSEADTWEAKLDGMPSGDGAGWRRATSTLGRALRRFILTRAFVGVISAAAYSAWIMPFGLDLILVWAILTFLMNFIPNVGAVVSGVLPTLYAFFTLDFGTALMIGAGLTVIEQVIGNWVDPRLQGNQVALSPVVILIAVVFWSWLWGVAGAFLGTPMTLAIMILCNNVAALRPVALILSNQPRSADLDEKLGWADGTG